MIGGIAHTHSEYATSWAQARKPIPCLGTTHADHFHGPIPVTDEMSEEEIAGEYELNTGMAIARTFAKIDPLEVPAVLVANHGPFAWGLDARKASETAWMLEAVARMAYFTMQINSSADCVGKSLHDRHFLRKHGKDAYYGQPRSRRMNWPVNPDKLPKIYFCYYRAKGQPIMAIVAGVDFGTLSVRVSIVDSERGVLATAVSEYPLHRKREDPEYATQSHSDQMNALASATRDAVHQAKISGHEVQAIAIDTTGSSVIPVGKNLEPLDEYYLWCDHRAKKEAAEITAAAHQQQLKAIEWCGGVYSSEWGFSKLLHWLRHNPDKRAQFESAFEHCDMVSATLCGITDARKVKRSICAMGHKWLWNAELGGLPSDKFLTSIDPLFAGVRDKLQGEYATSDCHPGRPVWFLGRKTGIEGRYSYTRRRIRRPLGRHRRRVAVQKIW